MNFEEEVLALRLERDQLLAQQDTLVHALAVMQQTEIRLHEELAGLRHLEQGRLSCSSHVYVSTACQHAVEPGRGGLHRECQIDAVRWDGTDKIAGQCKYCEAPCRCPCHLEDDPWGGSTDTADTTTFVIAEEDS